MQDLMFRHGRVILSALLVLTLVMGMVAALTLEVDNSPDIWLPSGDPEWVRYSQFKARFGEDDILALASARLDIHDAEVAKALFQFTEALGKLEGVNQIRTPFEGTIEEMTLKSDPLSLKLRGKGGRRFGLLLELTPSGSPRERHHLIAEIEGLARRYEPTLGPFTVVGTDVVTRDLDRGSEQSFGGLFPLVAIVLTGILYFSLRSFHMTVAILVAAVASAICTMGAMGLAGRSLNLLVVLIPAILVVLTVAAALHLCSRYLSLPITYPSQSVEARTALWKQAWAATVGPCALTTLTTVLGFASLGASQIGPVRDLGIFTALGTVWVFVFVFTILPLSLVRRVAVVPRGNTERAELRPGLTRYVTGLQRRGSLIIGAGLVFVVTSVWGVSQLRLESHVLRFFPESHPLPQAYADFETAFFGLTSLEVWVEGPRGDVVSAQTLDVLNALHQFAKQQNLVTSLLSPFEGLNTGWSTRVQALFLEPLFDRAATDMSLSSYLWTHDGHAAMRATLAAPTTSSNAAYKAVQALRTERDRLAKRLPEGVEIRISGSAPLLVRGQVLLLQTQVKSFLLAFGIIVVVVLIAYRSPRLTLVSVVPNVLPILGTLGLMGWLGITLNAGTATVAGIALGLVIDDTIHLMHHYTSRNREETANARVVDMLATVGWPVIITSIAVAVGFGLFGVAAFRPTRFFGLLIAVTSGFALICDLLLLPAILVRFPGVDTRRAKSKGVLLDDSIPGETVGDC